jgi:hypothetical protein
MTVRGCVFYVALINYFTEVFSLTYAFLIYYLVLYINDPDASVYYGVMLVVIYGLMVLISSLLRNKDMF